MALNLENHEVGDVIIINSGKKWRVGTILNLYEDTGVVDYKTEDDEITSNGISDYELYAFEEDFIVRSFPNAKFNFFDEVFDTLNKEYVMIIGFNPTTMKYEFKIAGNNCWMRQDLLVNM